MSKNTNKGNSYRLVMSKLKSSSESQDIFHLIGLIAACESIISDRLTAFLEGTNNEDYLKKKKKNKYGISFGMLLSFCKNELEEKLEPIKGVKKIETANLYAEIFTWKEKRNEIIHGVCKSNSEEIHKTEKELFQETLNACITGHRLCRLLLKWSQQRKK